MIIGPLRTQPAFDLGGLYWCTAQFTRADGVTLDHNDPTLGLVQIDLPEDLHHAVPKRRSEFLVGRVCAAMALRQLALPEHVGRKDRAPHWPAGTTGSITHTDNLAMAVASQDYRAVGIDCENVMDRTRADQINSMIVSDFEVSLRPASMPFNVFVTLIFSAKEAFYKAVSASVRRILEFNEVTLLSVTAGTLDLSFAGQTYRVLWQTDDQTCLTLIALPY